MSTADNFSRFCFNIKISSATISTISYRYKAITQRLNKDFWDIDSTTQHSLQVGSYGRGTDIHISDIDMVFQLPYSAYLKYDNYTYNGQSSLLQAVKNSLIKTYAKTDIGADGQVVQVQFSDGINYEIVPVFENYDGSFTYPDANNGGSWKNTNPRPEIQAINSIDKQCNGNLKELCQMARAWKDMWNIPMGGLLIDTLAANFIKKWEYRDKKYSYFDWMSRDFFKFLSEQDTTQEYWYAVGSNKHIKRSGSFEYKALRCYNIAQEAIDADNKNFFYTAVNKWREIYGNQFPF